MSLRFKACRFGQRNFFREPGPSVAPSTILRSTSVRQPLQRFLHRAGTVEGEERVRSYDLMIYSARVTTMPFAMFGDFSDNGI